jgi:hypothetical protein
MSVRDQIFLELADLEGVVTKLRAESDSSKKQTDLEVAILRKQIEKMGENNKAAQSKIDNAMNILEALK